MANNIKFGILFVCNTNLRIKPEEHVEVRQLTQMIKEKFVDVSDSNVYKSVVPKDHCQIQQALMNWVYMLDKDDEVETDDKVCHVIFTVGGTGLSQEDVTPEATKAILDRAAPGLSCMIILKGFENRIPMTQLSRVVCGTRNNSIIINLPDGKDFVIKCFDFIYREIPDYVLELTHQKIQVMITDYSIPQGRLSKLSSSSKVKIDKDIEKILLQSDKLCKLIQVENAHEIVINTIKEIDPLVNYEMLEINQAQNRILAENIKHPKKDDSVILNKSVCLKPIHLGILASLNKKQVKVFNPNAMKAALENALNINDVIIVGGCFDHYIFREVLIQDFEAAIKFFYLDKRNESIFATLLYNNKSKFVFGLPGNFGTVYVTCALFVIPALKFMEGNQIYMHRKIQCPLHSLFHHDETPNKRGFVPVQVDVYNENSLCALYKDANDLNNLTAVNGVLLLPGKINSGQREVFDVYVFDSL